MKQVSYFSGFRVQGLGLLVKVYVGIRFSFGEQWGALVVMLALEEAGGLSSSGTSKG